MCVKMKIIICSQIWIEFFVVNIINQKVKGNKRTIGEKGHGVIIFLEKVI